MAQNKPNLLNGLQINEENFSKSKQEITPNKTTFMRYNQNHLTFWRPFITNKIFIAKAMSPSHIYHTLQWQIQWQTFSTYFSKKTFKPSLSNSNYNFLFIFPFHRIMCLLVSSNFMHSSFISKLLRATPPPTFITLFSYTVPCKWKNTFYLALKHKKVGHTITPKKNSKIVEQSFHSHEFINNSLFP